MKIHFSWKRHGTESMMYGNRPESTLVDPGKHDETKRQVLDSARHGEACILDVLLAFAIAVFKLTQDYPKLGAGCWLK